jgi:hypothetical protein
MPTPEQTAMIERLRDVLAEDERIVSAWLSGSLGRGAGDAWSDVDVTCVVEEDDIAPCVAEYGGRRNPVGPTANQTVVHGRVAANISADWMRYDLLFLTPQEFRQQDPVRLTPLVRGAKPPTGVTRENVMDGARIAATATEFIRIIGLCPVAVGRREWISGVEGVALLRKMTIDLMIEANGLGHERGGVKRLNPFLTPEQRTALETSLAVEANRESLLGTTMALARLFFPLARRLVAERGGDWPQAFEDATWAWLQRELGVDPPAGVAQKAG